MHTRMHDFGSNLGMSSLVIGIISLLVFFMPVLGAPLSVFGLAIGVVGLLVGLFTGGVALRWNLGGLAISLLGLVVNLALANAPSGYFPNTRARGWQGVSQQRYVAPPATERKD
jgi:hypothetical protein